MGPHTQTQSRGSDLNDSAITYGTAGTATLAVGAAAAIGGVIWYFVHEGNRPKDTSKSTAAATSSTKVSFSASPTPHGGAGALGLSF